MKFRLYLADLDIKNKKGFIKQEAKIGRIIIATDYQFTIMKYHNLINGLNLCYETPIPDHRKFTIDLVLVHI